MAQYSLPSSAEVRGVLEGLLEEPIRVKLGSWNVPVDGLTAKMGFLYEYLMAGRISEVAGKYAPQRKHAIELKIDGIAAVMFVVKTAKRKTKRGWTLRPATVPLDPAYEPLAQKVYDYIKTFAPDEYPFLLAANPETSKRYAEAYAKEIFTKYHWHFVPYMRSAYADPSLNYTYDYQTRRRAMITDEKARVFGSKISYKKTPGWVPVSILIEGRWKSVNTHEFRKIRLRDLERPYYFDSTDLNYYAGWESKDREKAAAARHYLELDLDESPENIRILADMSKRYFKKLLIPIGNLLHSENAEIGGIEIIGF
jgi:hypothetical protein